MHAAKDQLRREMRERRLVLSPLELQALAMRASRHIATIPEILRARRVALYAAVRGEIGTGPIFRDLRAREVTVCYPRMTRGTRMLSFHAVGDEAELVPNGIGIPEPGPAVPEVSPGEIDVFVIPGLAFDRSGGRVGWGRAYYDTTLTAAPGALRVGLAYSFQVVAAVPQAASDEPLDILVTELGAAPTGARTELVLRRVR